MKARGWLALALLLALSAPVVADDARSQAKEHVAFGNNLAKSNLWGAATSHWEKAVKIDATYAAAWNNLGIGLEQLGKFSEAREAYEKALALDPNNTFINNNYAQFREIYDRQGRRRER